MISVFSALSRRYGSAADKNGMRTAYTGIEAAVSKQAMQAFCRLKRIPYIEGMEETQRICVFIDMKEHLLYELSGDR